MRSNLLLCGCRVAVLVAVAALTAPVLAGDPDAPARSPAAVTETRTRSDEMLATAVHEQLTADRRINAQQVDVAADGGVVRLSGLVPTSSERQTAEDIAKRVAGVREVENKLTVSSELEPQPGPSAIPERPAP